MGTDHFLGKTNTSVSGKTGRKLIRGGIVGLSSVSEIIRKRETGTTYSKREWGSGLLKERL